VSINRIRMFCQNPECGAIFEDCTIADYGTSCKHCNAPVDDWPADVEVGGPKSEEDAAHDELIQIHNHERI